MSGNTPPNDCPCCKKPIFLVDQYVSFRDVKYHRACFRCSEASCRMTLSGSICVRVEDDTSKLFCRTHFVPTSPKVSKTDSPRAPTHRVTESPRVQARRLPEPPKGKQEPARAQESPKVPAYRLPESTWVPSHHAEPSKAQPRRGAEPMRARANANAAQPKMQEPPREQDRVEPVRAQAHQEPPRVPAHRAPEPPRGQESPRVQPQQRAEPTKEAPSSLSMKKLLGMGFKTGPSPRQKFDKDGYANCCSLFESLGLAMGLAQSDLALLKEKLTGVDYANMDPRFFELAMAKLVTVKRDSKNAKCFVEFQGEVRTELSTLETLVNKYLASARNAKAGLLIRKKVISDEDINYMFGNVEELLEVVREITNRLSTIRIWSSNLEELPTIARLMRVFITFADNFHVSIDSIDHFATSNSDFLKAIGDSAENLKGLMCKTLNHSSSFHNFLLALKDNGTDSTVLHNAIKETEEIIGSIHLAKQRSSKRARMIEVHRRFPHLNLLKDPKREHVWHGSVAKPFSETMEITDLYLLSDVLILAKPFSTDKELLVPLRQMFSTDDGNGRLHLSSKPANFSQSLVIVDQGVRRKLHDTIASNNSNLVFGVSLRVLLDREDSKGIPHVVKTLTEFLKTKIETEHIFREAGSKKNIEALKELFNMSDRPPSMEVLKSMDVNDAVDVLKRFYREMPDRLLGGELYDNLKQLNMDDPGVVQALKEQLARLPRYNHILLKYQISFLRHVATASARNKMTPSNLARVFGPNICPAISAEVQNGQVVSKDSKKCHDIVTALIEHEERLLSWDPFPWSTSVHLQFPRFFRRQVKCMLMVVARLHPGPIPREILFEIFRLLARESSLEVVW